MSTRPCAQRLVGIDLARAVALLGMFAAHLLLPFPDGPFAAPSTAHQLVAGRSSALFALLAGVSIALVARPPVHAGQRWRLLLRALAITAIGLVLGLLDSGLAVILVYYGVLFCCALPVLGWGSRGLGLLALAWGLLSPVVSLLLRPLLPATTYQVPSLVSLAQPGQLLGELLVTGYYPVLTWATYLFAGLAVGRLDLRDPRWPGRLMLAGAWCAALAVAVSSTATRRPAVRADLLASWDRGGAPTWPLLERELVEGLYGTHPTGSGWWLAVWAPHSGSVVDLAHTAGCALLVVGLCLWLVRLTPRLPWRRVAGAGTATLSLYAVHVAVMASPLGLLGGGAWLVHAGAALLVGAALATARRRGPLEWLVREWTLLVPDGRPATDTR